MAYSEQFSHVRCDERITLTICQQCLRVVAFAVSAEQLEVAETAHLQQCHLPKKPASSDKPVPLLVWDNGFSVNITSLDNQHSRLVGMLNVLSESVARGEGKKVLTMLLNALMEYTKAHFATEEGLMAKHGYEALAEHKAEHDFMTATVLRFQREFEEKEQDISPRLLQFLREWLSNQILGTDRQYSTFLREHGER